MGWDLIFTDSAKAAALHAAMKRAGATSETAMGASLLDRKLAACIAGVDGVTDDIWLTVVNLFRAEEARA